MICDNFWGYPWRSEGVAFKDTGQRKRLQVPSPFKLLPAAVAPENSSRHSQDAPVGKKMQLLAGTCNCWQENATVGKKMPLLARKCNRRILDDSGIVRDEDCKATAAPAAYPSGTDFTELHKRPSDSPTSEAAELVSTQELSEHRLNFSSIHHLT